MFGIIIIITILTLMMIGYISTDPQKLNMYKSDAQKRFDWERAGYFYDWAPNLRNQGRPVKTPRVTLAPTTTTTPLPPCLCTPSATTTPQQGDGTTPTPSATTTPQQGDRTTPTPCVCPTLPPSTQPSKISDCKSFITAIGGLNDIVGCRNVLHAKCRDNKTYKPANAAEQKCADIAAKYSGNICNCMTQIHQVCLGRGKH